MKNFEKLYKILMNESDDIEATEELADAAEEQGLEGGALSAQEEMMPEEAELSEEQLQMAQKVYDDMVAIRQQQGKEVEDDLMDKVLDFLGFRDYATSAVEAGVDDGSEEGELAPDAPTSDDVADISSGLRSELRQAGEEEEDLYNTPDQD